VNHSASAVDCSLTPVERLELSYWGLPELVLMRYKEKGIR
jgi:hypothetical protein